VRVKRAWHVLERGREIHEMMQVVGEEGATLDDFVTWLKAEFLDAVYLQQNSFDPIDAACPIARQELLFTKVAAVLAHPFSFRDQDEARDRFVGLTDLFRSWNLVALADPVAADLMARIDAEIGRLQQEIERLMAQEAIHHNRSMARRLLAECGLPDPDASEPWAMAVVSERFLELLLAAPDEQAMRTLVEERARLVRALAGSGATRGAAPARPESRDQYLVHAAGALNTKSFVEAIT